MNQVQAKMLFSMVKPFLTPDKVRGAARAFIDWVKEFQRQIVLNPENGEIQIAAIFYETEGKEYFAIAMLNEENQIVRFDSVRELNELIELIISKM